MGKLWKKIHKELREGFSSRTFRPEGKLPKRSLYFRKKKGEASLLEKGKKCMYDKRCQPMQKNSKGELFSPKKARFSERGEVTI